MSDEKTEEPTEKKLEDAREKGESPKSQDLNASMNMIVMTVLLVLSSWIASDPLRAVFKLVETRAFIVQTPDETMSVMFEMLRQGALMALPYLVSSVLVGFIASFAQVGFIVSFEPIMPNFDKINPGSGIKKLFSLKSIMEFIKMVIKAVALGAVVYEIILSLMPLLIGTALHDAPTAVDIGWSAMTRLMGAGTLVFIVFGPLDFALQKWMFRRDQRMSKDEVKREHKEQEGDPELKGKRKQLAREYAFSAPQKSVAGANVVVTNPTHYAVALRYAPGEMPLPVVVAKGMDAEAAQIRKLAAQHEVPIVSNPPLARALHQVPVDDPIPEGLFDAVATVLRWVNSIDELSANLGGLAPDVLSAASSTPAAPGANGNGSADAASRH